MSAVAFCSFHAHVRRHVFRDLLQYTHGKMKSICFIHQKGNELFGKVYVLLLCDVICDFYSDSSRTRTNETASFI